MKVLSIFGTRPEMIKMWATLKKLDEHNFDHIMVHTGQNFTPELKDFFFNDLKLRKPDYDLGIDVSSYSNEVADVIKKTDKVMEDVKPDALLILGDTYSGLSIMPASYRGIKTFHMEAGLRAYDKRMPEQRNRILIDHMSDILLPYKKYHRENLIRENIHPSKIFVTGNTTFEAMDSFQDAIDSSAILKELNLEKKEYILMSAHRSENVDDPKILEQILLTAEKISKVLKYKVVFPMHPRTISKTKDNSLLKDTIVIKPLGFYDWNNLLKNSACVLSDSGTAAEEGLYYKVPNISLRMATERQETIESGGNIVSGLESANIIESIKLVIDQKWTANYDLEENHSPSSVVVNTLSTQLTNHF